MPTYDAYQTTFALSLASNLAHNTEGTEAELEALLTSRIAALLANPAIQGLIGPWTVAWGPFVFQAEGSKQADNAMVVFTNGATTVVAIAATNAGSLYDWIVLDANVHDTCAWPWKGTYAKHVWISRGTEIGINNLLGMPYTTKSKPSLVAFLKSLESGAAGKSLIFTGHSLAGALSPTLALALYNDQGALNRKAWGEVKVYPTAGYSPGNNKYFAFFATEFHPQPATDDPKSPQAWNRLVWNTLDVVPRAWDEDTLTGLTTLYGDTLTDEAAVEVWGLQTFAHLLSGPDYVQLQSSSLTDAVQGTVTTLDQFLAQMAYQHVPAYCDLLNVPELKPLLNEQNPSLLNPPAVPPSSKARDKVAAMLGLV